MDSNAKSVQDIMTEVLTPRLPETVERTPGMTRQEWRRKTREAKAKLEPSKLMRNGLPKQEVLTIVMVDCPKCGKHRHTKYLGEDGKALPVSKEVAEVRGEQRMLDVCGVCNARYREADRKFLMESLAKIQRAMRNRKINPTSDKDFSIDL